MSSALAPPRLPTQPAPQPPGPRKWTREEYYRLADLGFFTGQRAERIEGEILVQSPQNWPHASTTDRAAEVLRSAFGPGFWVRMQLPLEFGLWSDPEPDVSVVTGRREDYTNHPMAAVLVVEVSDTSASVDRGPKLGLYAAAGVPEYWVLNLPARVLEVCRDPGPDPAHPGRFAYRSVSVLSAGQDVAPLAAPGARLAVGGLLG